MGTMRKLFTLYKLQGWLLVLAFTAVSSLAHADDSFSIAIGEHDNLVIFGPNGQSVAELPPPAVSTVVKVGATTFQVSYGRDVNDLLTAIVAPNSSQPQDLHFTVLHKTIDCDKDAVVTLTFSPSLNHVSIDPGYVGTVMVNSEVVRHHDSVDTSYAAPPTPPPAPAPQTADNFEPRDLPPPTPTTTAPSAQGGMTSYEAENSPAAPSSSASPAATTIPPLPNEVPMATSVGNQGNPVTTSPPLVGTAQAQPPPPYSLTESAIGGTTAPKLFWSEPVTPPAGDGPAPTVALDQMKLIEVQGSVSITSPDGKTQPGQDGMIIPSGSTVSTSGDSSAALFMGGVNSARFLPDSEAKVDQDLDASVRHTTIDLHQGTIFSRVGRRAGESEDYKVTTPEGVGAARGTDFADTYAKGEDGQLHHYLFVTKGTVDYFLGNDLIKVVTGRSGHLGSFAYPPSSDTGRVLQGILEALQPFNVKLNFLLTKIDNGTATPSEIAFYDNLLKTFFGSQLPDIIEEYEGYADPARDVLQAARRALNQDLNPFQPPPHMTPF